MATTPQITLTADLKSILAGVSLAGSLQITLCGFGPALPAVAGAGMVANAGIPETVGPQVGDTAISIALWGNDQITPAGTFYCITVLDEEGNAIQSGNYQFNGTATVDLSTAIQILPGGSLPPIPQMKYRPCAGAVPGSVYTAPGAIVMLFYNGSALPAGAAAPTLSYTAVGNVATLNFTTESGVPDDRIDALCVVS
jgi:hypothetical protein